MDTWKGSFFLANGNEFGSFQGGINKGRVPLCGRNLVMRVL